MEWRSVREQKKSDKPLGKIQLTLEVVHRFLHVRYVGLSLTELALVGSGECTKICHLGSQVLVLVFQQTLVLTGSIQCSLVLLADLTMYAHRG